MNDEKKASLATSPAVAELILVWHLRDEEVSHGEMEGLAPDRAGHSG